MSRIADTEVQMTERVKKQLLWAFDDAGNVNAENFVTILEHEDIDLANAELIALVSELARVARRVSRFVAGCN